MIGYYITTKYIADSNGNVATGLKSLKVLEYLLKDYQDNELTIVYQLDASFAGLLNQIGLTFKEAKKLLNDGILNIPPYTIKYYPKKMFCIDYGAGIGHQFRNFYNAAQFSLCPLDEYNSEQGIEMAKEALKIGKKTVEALKAINLPYYKLTSPISLYLKSNNGISLDFAKVEHLPDQEIGEYAYCSLKGNWLEAYKAGFWENAYDYDINGAYAYEISNLPDLRLGEWVNSVDIPEYAMLGFAIGELELTSNFHPFIIKSRTGENLLPTGEGMEEVLALNKIKLLQQYPEVGTFQIKNGWWWVPNKPLQYPFKYEMERIYNQRCEIKSICPKAGELLHRIMAGIWGKLIEYHNNSFGDNFNPVYGAIVESNVAVKVFKTCKSCGIVPLHVAVDGIITEKELPIETGNKFGGWRLSHSGKCIIVNASTVGFEGKNGKEEFSITYEWLKRNFSEQPESNEYTMHKKNFISLRKAVMENRLSEIGNIIDQERKVYTNTGNRRIWDDEFTCGRDILEKQLNSFALSYNSLLNISNLTKEKENGM